MQYFSNQQISFSHSPTISWPRTGNDNAIEDINSFFIDISREQVESIFSSILETCLTSEDPAFETAEARFELLLILKKIKCLIEAASVL